MSLRAVLFDLDGTLLDTSRDLGGALNQLLKHHGKNELSYEQFRAEVSNGANALIKLGFGELDETKRIQYRQELLAIYASRLSLETKPFDGIEQLIETLKTNQLIWGIVTNKPKDYTLPLLETFSFASEPAVIICPQDVEKPKPSPESLFLACNRLNIEPYQALYIGDHIRDIECGRRASMNTIAVGYGYTQHAEEYLTWGADHHALTPHDLWPIIHTYLTQSL